jgi:hypothetical protein
MTIGTADIETLAYFLFIASGLAQLMKKRKNSSLPTSIAMSAFYSVLT